MSVILMGMEMPETCIDCQLYDRHYRYGMCKAHWVLFGQEDGWKYETRPNWCPLRPLPNVHGDLIDRDALPSRVEWEDIVNAPAIVGAEWEEPIKITGKIYFVDGCVYIDPEKEDKR